MGWGWREHVLFHLGGLRWLKWQIAVLVSHYIGPVNVQRTHGGWSKFIFFSKRPFLAKKNYFSQTFAISTKKKLSRAPMLDYMWEFLVGNKSLTRDIWASSERLSDRLHIHMWCFAFHGGPCSPSPASSDTSTPKLRAHLPPVPLETRHNKSTV